MTAMRYRLRTSRVAKALFVLGLLAWVVGWAHACIVLPQQPAGGYVHPVQAQAQHGPDCADRHGCIALPEDLDSACSDPHDLAPTPEAPRVADGTAWPVAIPAFAPAWAVDRVASQDPPRTGTLPPGVSVVLGFLRLTL